MGRTAVGHAEPFLDLRTASGTAWRPEGVVRSDGLVLGTYVHGLFDGPELRRSLLNHLRAGKAWPARPCERRPSTEDRLDRLADFVQAHLDVDLIDAIIEQGAR